MPSRRKFLESSAMLIAGAGLLPSAHFFSQDRSVAPSDRIRLASVGIKGMGWSNTQAALRVPGVELVAVCDIDQTVIKDRLAEYTKNGGDASKIKVAGDYRELLDDKDIDVVMIGTPDHWHALQMVHSVQAGKHVYVEKPAGNSMGECKAMVNAQEKTGKLVQVGQWQRSQQHFRDAVDFVHSGQLGMIRTVKVWCYQGWMRPASKVADSAAPAGVDYKTWLGPAPLKPFNASRFHFNFRWFWDYAGGLMTDWGVHLLDYGLLGMKATAPKTIAALGGHFAYPDLAQETPDTLTTLYEFDGFNLVWDSAMGIDNGSYGRDHGIAFIGNNGTLILDRGGWEVIEERQSKSKVVKPHAGASGNGLVNHWTNFIDAIRNNQPSSLNCSIQEAAHVANIAQMGNIAYRSGEKLTWDNKKEAFTNKKVQEQYYVKKYYNGYELPV